MEKTRNTPLVLLTLLSALAVLSIDALTVDRGRLLAQNEPEPTPTFIPPNTLEAGTTLRIDGTPVMGVINRSLAESFESHYPGSEIKLAESSTDAALTALQQNNIDLAATGRPLSEAEKAQNLSQVTIDREKIAIIVGRDNPFQGDINYQDFVRIFRGEITNWAEIGGPNVPIRFIDRPPDSDTRRALEVYEIFQGQPFQTGPNAIQVPEDDTAAVIRELRNDGISYAIAGQILGQDSVRALSMNSTLPDDPRYPYSQPRGYVYRGEPSIPVEAFLGFATHSDGETAIKEAKATEKDNVTAGADQLPGDLAISPDGEYMVQGNRYGQLQWLDARGTPTGQVDNAHDGVITAVAISPDSQTVVSAGADGTIRRWDQTGQPLGDPIQGSDGPVMSLAFSPDGQTLLTGNNDGTLQRWNAATGESLGPPIEAHSGPVQTIAYPPGGQNIITGGTDGSLKVWNPDGTAAAQVANAHEGGITAITVSSGGDQLLTGGADGHIRLWDRATLMPRGNPIPAYGSPITAVAISNDNQRLAATDLAGNLGLWDPNGNPINPEPITLAAPANALSFTPSGEVVVGNSNGPIELRDQDGNPSKGQVPDLSNYPSQLSPDLANFLNRIRNLPRSTWWMLAAIPALLFLAGLLGTIFGWGRKSTDPDPNDDLTPIPGSGLGINFSGVDQGTSSISTGPIPDQAGVIAVEGGDIDTASLGSKLAQAKADLTEGKRLARAGQYNLALGQFDAALEAAEVERVKAEMTGTGLGGVNAITVQALTQKGHVLTAMDQPDDALYNYNAALQIDSSALEAWIGKGRLLTEMGQYEEAIFCFDTALEIDANAGQAWAGKGRTLMLLGRQAEGQSCLDRAAALGVTGPDSLGYPAQPVELGAPNEPISPLPMPPSPDYGSISPTPLPTPQPVGIYDPDVPPELQQAIQSLPSADATVPYDYPDNSDSSLNQPYPPGGNIAPTPLPQPGVAYDPDIPLELQQAIQSLPSVDATVPHDSPAVTGAGLPPEVLAAMGQVSPSGLPFAGNDSPNDDDFLAGVDLPPITATTAPSPYPAASGLITPVPSVSGSGGQPVNPSLEGLPPEVLAALASIPADSPDSFGLAPTTIPATTLSATTTPVPSTAPAGSHSWITLSLDDTSQRLYGVWHITDADRMAAKQQGGQSLILRLYDVTGQSTTMPLSPPVDQRTCPNEQSRDWYLDIPNWDRIYLAEIGYGAPLDRWLPIARSAELPVLTR